MTTDIVEEYNPKWPEIFQSEKNSIIEQLSGINFAIYHIGSTSVPGLRAKPIIDIMIVSDDFDKVISSLEREKYNARGEFNVPFHECLTKRCSDEAYNLHLFTRKHPEIKLHLLFRDFLRANKSWRDKYSDLKNTLSQQNDSFKKGEQGVKKYTLAKNDLIVEILNQAGFNEYSLKYCMHDSEWREFYRISKQKEKIEEENIYQRTKFHFILYKGTNIVAVATIKNNEISEIFAINNEAKYIQEMNNQLKKWLDWQHKNSISRV